MTFEETLAQVRELLAREGRVAYRILKRRFALDDQDLEDLKADLIDAKQMAIDEGGKVLVWAGGALPSTELQTPDLGLQTEHALQPEAERRQLTVMFCDLVDSTALSAQLDPEEYRELVRNYQHTSAAVIERFGGYIAQYLGDGLLVYFGYPAAHEDDAQQAIRTGLEILAGLESLNAQLPPTLRARLFHPLQVRIGIHTGLVVVGKVGGGARGELLALGETPNIAARIQEEAEPDTVTISETTHRLVEGLFECEDSGRPELKGISTPLTLYRVVKESEAQSRFEVAVHKGLTPLVGRVEEFALLQRHWEHAKTGAGQVVLLSGEPGIGKSRLVQEFKEQLAREGATRIEFRCSLNHQNSALYPIIDHLQRLLQFEREDAPATKLEKLQHTLSHYRFPQADTVPLLAALLSLPHPEGYPPLTDSPQKQKEKTQAALVAWLVEETERAAVYCGWKDLHWADPSTLEVLTLLLDQVPTMRMLALLTFRPEFTPPWRNRSHLSQMTLSRLGRPHIETMIKNVTHRKALPAEVVQHIVAMTDGVPLFVEELTKTVVESGLLREEGDRYVGAHGGAPILLLAIPATLQDSLMARLDRLAPVKELAQLGATLGREFSYEVLHAVSSLDEGSLQQRLRQLVEVELLYQRGLPPHATYFFKHALIQDTAYHSLLKSKRQHYHHRIARVLEEQFPETKETQPELVAHHYTEAGLVEQAIPYWQQAGQRALQRSAPAEALSHLTKGLEVLTTLPDTPERTQQELTLQTTLGATHMALKGYASPEVDKAYTRARQLCQQEGEISQLFPTLWGLGLFYLLRAELQTTHELGEQLLTLAQNAQDPALLLEAHYTLGVSLFFLGEPARARPHLEQCTTLYDIQQHGSHAFLYGQDPGVFAHIVAALALWVLGYADQALERIHKASLLAQEVAHQFSLAGALVFVAWIHHFRREGHETLEQAQAAITLSDEQGFPFWMAWGTILRGWALAEEEEGIAQMRQGLSSLQATGAELVRPYIFAKLGEAYGAGGQPEKGLISLAEALPVAYKTGEHWSEAEVYRLRGELTLQKLQVSDSTVQAPDPQHVISNLQAEAEAYFQKAIDIARQQQAKSWELRASTSLARLWQQQGKQREARQMLAEIYRWFTQGFGTKDLQEAKALLDELA
jgi:class 3 adenylate cyclase/predicted ATPase